MGSLLITPFSCTLKPTVKINMKVFATLATVLGASAAAPLNQMHSSNMRMDQHSMKPSMGMSMESQMSQRGMSDRHMDMNRQMTNMRDMYRDNQQLMGQDMGRNMMDQDMGRSMMGQDMSRNMMGQEMSHNMMGKEMGLNMMGQDMRSNMRDMYRDNQDMTSNMMHQNMIAQDMQSNMRDMHRQNQAFEPNQYFKKDDFGNYVYSYNDQQSEKSEEGNNHFTKGQYAYIMSNGVKRKVEYIADDNGFHIIKDNADPARIKRSSEPDLLQTKMTSVMDSSSLRDDGRDMSSQMAKSMMGGSLMDQGFMGRNMLDQDSIGRNLMGRNVYSIMSNRGMASDMSSMMKQQMDSNTMGHDMTMDVMGHNRINQARNTQMMGGDIMMGQGMMDMTNSQTSSNMMSGRGMMDSRSDNGLMGQRMMQKMEIEHVPETYMSTRFY